MFILFSFVGCMSNPFEQQLTEEEIEQFYLDQSVHLDKTPLQSPLFKPFHSRELDAQTCSLNPLSQPNFEQGESSSPSGIYTDFNASSSSSSTSNSFEMAIRQPRTLKELAAPTLENQPLCINVNNANFELKFGFIHLLPIFNGLAGEDPHAHLKEFHMVCNGMKPQAVDEEQVKLKAFPFSLKGAAKEWLFSIPSGSINTWNDLKRIFLEKYFPASRAANIRKEICGIRQSHGESFSEYWERFEKLCTQCPHHQIPDQLLIQYFYEGLTPQDRSIVDAASGGALVDKTPDAAKHLISNMAANSKQFGNRGDYLTKRVNEVSDANLETKVSELTSLVRSLMCGNDNVAKVCGICSMNGHTSDICPQLVDDSIEHANSIGGNFNVNLQRKYDPYSQTYNPGWRDHPNFRYGNPNQPHQTRVPNPPGFNVQSNNQTRQLPPPINSNSNGQSSFDELKEMRDMMKHLATNAMTLQQNLISFQQETRAGMQETRASVQSLEKQVGQLASSVGKLEAQASGRLPSQALNPKESVQAIELRSGRTLGEQKMKGIAIEEEEEIETDANLPKKAMETSVLSKSVISNDDPKVIPSSLNSNFKLTPPFPLSSSSAKAKKEEKEKEILELFKKVEINIPLLDAIRQVPKYAKFLKELCTTKRAQKLKGHETVSMGEVVSAVVQKKLPMKQKDPGAFAIPCVIGNTMFDKALCDLGASISVMPKHVYDSLSLEPLNSTSIVIQFADRSYVYPLGMIEDVLVKIGELLIPCDFYVLDMEFDHSHKSTPILFGRPFLKTAKTKIDCEHDTLSMSVGDEIVEFNISDALRYPYDHVYSIMCLDHVDELVQDRFDFEFNNGLDLALWFALDIDAVNDDESDVVICGSKRECVLPSKVHDSVLTLHVLPSIPHDLSFIDLPISYKKLLPSILCAPELELKPLPENLKYVFLGENNTLPVIIAKNLTSVQEKKLVNVLKEHRTAIGWTLADIKGISPSMCMHRILLEDGAKPTREMQRRLNPPMMDVVKTEILKLLDAGVIYPITDSKWVAPIHVVPKKTRLTVVKNARDELIPQRVHSGWRMRIDYWKLNLATRKDHFPLPFMDQMLERLAGKSFYCFLDGYSGYNQL